MDNFELIYALFNQYLFQGAKNRIELVDYYFKSQPMTQDSPLVYELVEAIRNYRLEDIGEPLFKTILMKTGKTPKEAEEILNKIREYKSYSAAQIEPFKNHLEKMTYLGLVNHTQFVSNGDPELFVKTIKSANIPSLDVGDSMDVVSFSDLDLYSILAEEEEGYTSSMDWVNDLFSSNSIPKGSSIIVSCPPGTGKTLILMAEALHHAKNGIKTHFLSLGDMKPRDFILRMAAIYSGLSFRDSYKQIERIYKELSNILKDNLLLTVLPADTVTVENYVETIKRAPYSDCKVLMIDYDANFRVDETQSTYLEYGRVYDKLTELTLGMGKTVYIACQPKATAWGTEKMLEGTAAAQDNIITMSQISSESSKKVCHVDFAMSFSKTANCGVPCGIAFIAKNRRGISDVRQYYVRLNSGQMMFISPAAYERMKQIPAHERMDFSRGEVEKLEAQLRMANNPIGGSFGGGNNGSNGGSRKDINPFK